MIKYIIENSISYSIIGGGFVISIVIYFFYNLDVLQKVFSILGSLSLVIAFSTYFYKKQQDKILATIEQVVFFREKIIPEWTKISKSIIDKNPKYMFSHIKLGNGEIKIENIKKEFPFNFDDQFSIFTETTTGDLSLFRTNNILNEQITLLNMLEEFSLRVNYLKTQQHPALESVRDTFVSLIQMNAVAMLYERDIMSNGTNYQATLSLYNSWESKYKKPNVINNLEKHGFISKDKKEKILKKQRENVLERVAKNKNN